MDFRLLGPVQAVVDEHPIELGGPKQVSLLVLLLLNPGRAIPRERLLDLIWDGEPPGTAAHALEVYASDLRRRLPGCEIRSQALGYLLPVAEEDIDLERFKRLAQQGRRALERDDDARARRLLGDALELWRGPAFGGVGANRYLDGERARLEEMRLSAIEDRMDAEVRLGGHAALIPELRRLVAENPYRERLCGQLMLALYRTGRQAEASEVYQALRTRLADELGMSPGPELQEVLGRILRQEPGLAGGRPATNLPAPLTSFVGRSADLPRVADLLERNRMVTLVGPGGIGKTRLALQAGRELLESYPDGVWLAVLSDLRDGAVIPDVIRTAMRLTEGAAATPLAALAANLKPRRALIVLDNCEHLLDDAAKVVESLLSSCPRLACLATSRERLRFEGEQVWTVEPLQAGSDAVRLFLDRAALARPSFDVDEENAAAIEEICRRLDGIPLALELAAAQTGVMSAAELLRRLEDPHRLLASGSRAGPGRHRTLEAAVAWSYGLLGEEDRIAFDRLSVFRGFDAEAATAVCGEHMDALRLADKSLVAFDGRRYRLLETMRAFAAERLAARGETRAMEAAHRRYYLGLVEGRRPGDLAAWLHRMEIETDNLRAALDWSVEHDHAAAARLVIGLDWWWRMRSHIGEVRLYLARLLQARGLEDAVRVRLLAYQGWFNWDVDGPEEISATGMETAVALARAVGDGPALADALLIWSRYATNLDQIEVAERLLSEALELLRGGDDAVRLAEALHQLGVLQGARFDLAEACTRLEESLAIQRSLGRSDEAAITLGFLGGIVGTTGELERGRALVLEALRLGRELGGEPYLHQLLDIAAGLAIVEGRPDLGLNLTGAADAALERARWKSNRTWDRLMEAYLRVARDALGPEQSDAALQAGRLLGYSEAVARALAWLEETPR